MTGTRALDVLAFDGARRERLVLAVGGNALTGRKVTTIEGEFTSSGTFDASMSFTPETCWVM